MSRQQPPPIHPSRTSSSATEFGILRSIFRNIDSRSLALGIPAAGRRGCHQPQAHMHALLSHSIHTDFQLAVEAAGPPQRRVQGIRPIGRAQDNDVPAGARDSRELRAGRNVNT
jgi:hypothetical protein